MSETPMQRYPGKSSYPDWAQLARKIQSGVNRQRLVETAVALVEIPSPTCSAGAVADRLAQLLADDGFDVERPIANWPQAPAVVTRLQSARKGPVLQFDGHLDTVHLPFVPPRVEAGMLYGSGASDMKGGIAAYVEALRVLRELDLLTAGGILLTAHDHHEGPWGDRRQLRALINEGYMGDAVLVPEYLADRLPVAGRGMAIFEIEIRRLGEPVHEVLRGPDTPDVIAAGVLLHHRLQELGREVSQMTAPYAGQDSVFVGAFQSGEIFNQSPILCKLSGTRRWVTPGETDAVLAQLRTLLDEVAAATSTQIDVSFDLPGDAFRLDTNNPFAEAFQAAHETVTGENLPLGNKPFVDDGNLFAGLGKIPAITHGPDALGAHTTDERVALDELVRVANVYALTAVGFCRADLRNV